MTAIDLLEQIHRLMQLKGENPFKVRAFEKAISQLAGRDDLEQRARAGTLTELEGIGKGISEVLTDFLVRGKTPVLDELRASLPPGLAELAEIPGLGPKKAQLLIDELGITSVGELEYACRENRLLKIKGFGEKAQKKILDGIEFQKASSGKQRFADALPIAETIAGELAKAADGRRVSETGALRRKLEILSELDYLVELPETGADAFRERMEKKLDAITLKQPAPIPVKLHFASPSRYGYELARTTATAESWKAQGAPAEFDAADEQNFFKRIDLSFLPPETRETGEEVKLARAGKLDALLPEDGLQGVFHNHTTASDGVATLEQMVLEAKRLGFRYIGISDHSQSAFYAQGLKSDALAAQEKEIRKFQEKHPDIRIFWGIESDILKDGSLDYDAKTLKKFDFVIGSVHSRFGMDRETMTERLLTAIRNPAIRFVGHLTGRLLLGRAGYELDFERVIAEAARHDVAIEINANPARLDIDWRWGTELRKQGTLVSVNPDAHDTANLADTRFGVTVARKALLPASQVLNSRSAKEVEKWLRRE